MRRGSSLAGVWVVAIVAALVGSRGAQAFEAFDGRIQVHGFGETVLRGISSDFSEDLDLTQWQFVLNVELEADIAPYGWGPFSSVSAFVRAEARYDCLWSKACSLSDSVKTYGDRSEQGPEYLTDGEDPQTLYRGTSFAHGNPVEGTRFQEEGRYVTVLEHPLLSLIVDSAGVDQIEGTADDPAPNILGTYESPNPNGDVFGSYTLLSQDVPGPINGKGRNDLGPWKPKEHITSVGALRNVPNPLSPIEVNPLTGSVFPGARPFRPFPTNLAGSGAPLTEAQGYYFPSPGLQELLRDEKLDPFDQNFRERELMWNRGGSQQDEKELKEAYLDLEFLDGRLWIRLGKQTIVWGKTEIFRSQDQFNPQDLGLSTLPSLEESRIGLWAIRAVWSFYDVGPLQDVRLELAMLLDDYEPADLGVCGEPYAPLPVCQKSLGLFAHGLTGLAVAGEVRPPAWWNDTRGIEAGARLEFRWRRFSFALTNFYGYSDLPYQDIIFKYRRNVDPMTGRPRRANSDAGCDPEGLYHGDTAGCLGGPDGRRIAAALEADGSPGGFSTFPATSNIPGRITDARTRFDGNTDDIRANHSANQSLFAVICGGTQGFSDLFPGLENECSFSVFGSQVPITLGPATLSVAEAVGQTFGGSNNLVSVLASPAGDLELLTNVVDVVGTPAPLVPLNSRDPRTGEGRVINGTLAAFVPEGNLASMLTPEQQGLLGCGAFYGTSCDSSGVDLLNAEASALLQSFPGFDGSPLFGFTLFSGPQPGTLAFDGGPVCTRFSGGETWILPGCRGPGDAGYDPSVDGIPVFRERDSAFGGTSIVDINQFNMFKDTWAAAAGVDPCPDAQLGDRLFHPFTCSPFRSEMAALSYNFLMLAILFSQDLAGMDDLSDPMNFDVLDPNRLFEEGRCSFTTPQYCSVIRAVLSATGTMRNDIKAAGNGRFGRRDFIWHGGYEAVLRYAKRNVLGFSMDFAEDWSKTNWSIEATWLESLPVTDYDSNDGITDIDIYNLTISVDRPTFVNFLNSGRTFLFNSQWFIQYRPQHDPYYASNGPWNVLGTFTIISGYFQDRLLTNLTLVYDFGSNSGAGLPSITYRFSERFSAQLGMAFFFGRFEQRPMPLMPASLGNNVGKNAYHTFVENGLAVVRDRDEAYLRLRWTF